ncbi:MAG: hypothetical protein ABIT47_03955 [Candidatus Paceibacterota bacterium]
MKILRIFLLVLIIIGVGLLVTQASWVPSVVSSITAHDPAYEIVPPPATSTVKHIAPKPVSTVPPQVDSGVDGVVTIGPTCPVQQYPDNGACADKPYETTLAISTTQTGQIADVIVKTNAQGRFSADLQPGTYTIRAQSAAILPRLAPQQFTVVAHKRTTLTLQFDSGIR